MTEMPGSAPMSLNADLARRVQEGLGQNVFLCYQCVKCTSGCPVAEFFDWQPNQIMRALQLGQDDIALGAQTPWLCAACQTCTTRCPQALDIAAIMEFLSREARARGIAAPVPEVPIFNEAFLREVRLWGRAYELGLMAEMKLRTRNFTGDLDLGVKMMRKRKLAFLPRRVRPPHKVKPVAAPPNAVGYYPGCSLHSTAREYDVSTQAVCGALNLPLVEPRGWVCCGSSAAHRADPDAALRLPLENLALIEQSGLREVTMPCAACFNRHKAAQFEIRHDAGRKAEMDRALGYSYQDTVQVSTLIEAITQHVGAEAVGARVQRPLAGLRVVCYYGCLLTRPPEVTGAERAEYPLGMDRLIEALGGTPVDWDDKVSCCGASLSLTRTELVLELSGRILENAQARGAEVVAVACPLCHANLDGRQTQMKIARTIPTLYFTQLMALAFGLPEEAALSRNMIDPRPVLATHAVL